MKDLAGYRKSHTLPDRANDWARKYVNRIAAADIKADLDNMFDMVREQFGYKRKDLDVSAERDGLGFIRTPDFEYTVSLEVNPDEPTEVIWRREIGRLSGPEFVRSEGVPGGVRLDVRPARLRVRRAGGCGGVRGPHRGLAAGGREGERGQRRERRRDHAGRLRGEGDGHPDAVTIHGRAGDAGEPARSVPRRSSASSAGSANRRRLHELNRPLQRARLATSQ